MQVRLHISLDEVAKSDHMIGFQKDKQNKKKETTKYIDWSLPNSYTQYAVPGSVLVLISATTWTNHPIPP